MTREAVEKVKNYIDIGVKEGATLAVDGRGFKMQGYENGFYLGGSLFDNVTKDMRIYKEEIFGPVLSVVRAHDYKEALALPSDHDYGNGVAIFTRDGDAARDFAAKVNVGMVGINVPIPVPIAYYTFGGWKKSGFGDLNQHGPDSIRFYTKTKTVTSRWPSGVKEGAEFSIPTMNLDARRRSQPRSRDEMHVRSQRGPDCGSRYGAGIRRGKDRAACAPLGRGEAFSRST